MARLLDPNELADGLRGLGGWTGDTGGIVRSVEAATFAAGIALVDAVALAADELDHHPDIDIRWTTVTFRCATHSKGGVTDADLVLAGRIDDIVARATA